MLCYFFIKHIDSLHCFRAEVNNNKWYPIPSRPLEISREKCDEKMFYSLNIKETIA